MSKSPVPVRLEEFLELIRFENANSPMAVLDALHRASMRMLRMHVLGAGPAMACGTHLYAQLVPDGSSPFGRAKHWLKASTAGQGLYCSWEPALQQSDSKHWSRPIKSEWVAEQSLRREKPLSFACRLEASASRKSPNILILGSRPSAAILRKPRKNWAPGLRCMLWPKPYGFTSSCKVLHWRSLRACRTSSQRDARRKTKPITPLNDRMTQTPTSDYFPSSSESSVICCPVWVKLCRRLNVRAESAFPTATDIVDYGRAFGDEFTP